MKIEFTIGWDWVETLCHLLAALLYIATGFDMATERDFGIFKLVMAIGFTIIGAGL